MLPSLQWHGSASQTWQMTEDITFDFADVAPSSDWRYRDYQVEALTKIEEGWAKFQRQLLVLPTGGGKTIVFAAEAKRTVHAGGRVLVLTHIEELFKQAADKIQASTGLLVDREKAELHASLESSIVVASIQTLQNVERLRTFPHDHFAMVIVDECHHLAAASWSRVVNYFQFGPDSLAPDWKMPLPDEKRETFSRCLGVTATPDRADRKSLGNFYQHCALNYDLLNACRDGWLVRPLIRNIPVKIDLSGVNVRRTKLGAELDVDEVIHRITPFLGAMCEMLTREIGNRRGVVFVPSVRIAEMCAEMVNNLGVTSASVSGDDPARTDKVERFRQGRPQVMFCALLLVEGFDDDGVSFISIWRPTKIRSFYAQAIGRGMRTLTGLLNTEMTKEQRLQAIRRSAKPDLLILDPLWLGDNLSLISPVDLVARNPQIRELMLKQETADLIESESNAEFELLASLERAAKEQQNRRARTYDPLEFAAETGAKDVVKYEPAEGWEFLEPTPAQLQRLHSWRLETKGIENRGMASRLIELVARRSRMGLARPGQMKALHNMGYKNVAEMTAKAGDRIIEAHRAWADKKAGRTDPQGTFELVE
jgi:superfamily II DNA or RNA helicase